MCKYSPGICSSFIHSIVPNDSVNGQRRSESDCADAQADLGIRCPHMPEDRFSHGAPISFGHMRNVKDNPCRLILSFAVRLQNHGIV